MISISDAQRRPVPQANFIKTIYHGLPETLLTPQDVKPSYLAVLGRIAPEKGVDRAIKIAIRAGIPLKIAAKVDRADEEYYETVVKPLMDHPLVEFIGEISDREKPEFLSGPHGLLLPIDWPEPFGLVMIEAMACGAPVIAYNRGSVPEIIDQGLTGFIVEDELSAVNAVGRWPTWIAGRSESISRNGSVHAAWRRTMSKPIAARWSRRHSSGWSAAPNSQQTLSNDR